MLHCIIVEHKKTIKPKTDCDVYQDILVVRRYSLDKYIIHILAVFEYTGCFPCTDRSLQTHRIPLLNVTIYYNGSEISKQFPKHGVFTGCFTIRIIWKYYKHFVTYKWLFLYVLCSLKLSEYFWFINQYLLCILI